jgi:hypothetical protein
MKSGRKSASVPNQQEGEEFDPGQLFDVQYLTKADIVQLEEALNAMDIEEMVATVDAIVGRHHAGRKKVASNKR